LKTTFWEIQRKKKRAITLLFIIFFPFFTLSLFGLLEILRLTSFGFLIRGASPLELLLLSALASILVYIIGIAGARRERILRYLEILKAQKPDKDDLKHKQVENVVNEMSVAATVSPPEVYIIPVLAKNAFSAFNIIAITEGAVSSLERDELQGVIAHEMAHYLNGDSYYKGILSTFVMTLSFFSSASFYLAAGSSSRSKKKGIGGGFWLVFIYLMFVEFLSRLINSLISREIEERADAMAVQFTRNPLSFASALWKVSRDRTRGISAFNNPAMASLFIVNPTIKGIDEISGFLGNIFSTHPPVKKRIKTMLELAGVGEKELIEKVKVSSPKREWWVEKDETWLGPFSMEELLEKTWIGEGVKIKGKTGIVTLKELLSRFKPTEGNCPRCNGPLFYTYYENVPILRCGRCGGIIVREDRVLRIIAREEDNLSAEEIKYTKKIVEEKKEKLFSYGTTPRAVDPTEPLRCPFCGKPMQRRFFNFITYTPVDYCPKCRLYFFGSGEVEMITAGLKRVNILYT